MTCQAELLKTILLVADKPDDLDLLQGKLLKSSAQLAVEAVGSLVEAEERLGQCDLSVVLLDLCPSTSEGLEALARLCCAGSNTPVVVLTETADEEFAIRAMELGAQDCIQKPWRDSEEVLRVLGRAVARGRFRSKERSDLSDSEALFRAMFEQAAGYWMILEPQESGIPTILDANDAACEAHGFTREELLGRPVAELDDEEGKRLVIERTKKILTGAPFIIETDHVRKDGTTFPVAVCATVVRLPNKPPLIFTVETDISSIKEAEKNRLALERQKSTHLEDLVAQRTASLESVIVLLREREARISRQNAELEHANLLKSEFLATMSHELRTPLNAIIGFSDVMVDGLAGGLNERQADYTQEILSSGKHLLSLINDILDLSKIEAGKLETELSKVDIRSLCKNSLTVIKSPAAQGKISLAFEYDEAVEPFWVDERKLKQVLYNLLSNSVKFTSEGGMITLRVRRREDGQVSFQVEDTGIGISREDQAKLFVPFQQLGKFSTRSYKGTGLGLALSKQFVELMNGTIRVESEFGRGSVFEVLLPYRLSNPEAVDS